MSKRTTWHAFWAAVGAFAAFALIVYAVSRYEDVLTKINWALVSLLSAFVFGSVAIYRWNDELAKYSLVDLVMNPKTGKPDPYRHLLFLFAGLTVWAIVQVVLAKEWGNLNALLLGALGFFVAKPTIDGISDAIASRTVVDQSSDVAINMAQASEPKQLPAAEAASELDEKNKPVIRGKKR